MLISSSLSEAAIAFRNNLWEGKTNYTLARFLEKYKRFPVIAVTWPAWVWKTTITEIIAKYYWAVIFREVPEENPFLKIISQTRDKTSEILRFQNQMFFCATDSAILVNGFSEAKEKPIVFDFAITQVLAYGNLKLCWQERVNFNNLFNTTFHGKRWQLFEWLPRPDLIIEVKATDETIIARREKRRHFLDAKSMDEVWKMNLLYNSWFVKKYFWDNVIVFNNDSQNSPEELIEKVNDFLKSLTI